MACEAISTYEVTIELGSGTKIYEWSVSGNAYFTTSNGSSTISVGTNSSVFEEFTLSCKVTDDTGNSFFSSTFVHTRSDDDLTHEDTLYLMDEPMIVVDENTRATIDFHSDSDPQDDGIFYHSGGGKWIPTSGEYPEDGTLILLNGDYLEIPYIFPSASSWMFTRAYDVDISSGIFKIMSIVYKGNGYADFYYGDEINPPSLAQHNTNIAYTPPAINYKITEILDIPSVEVIYEMDDFFTPDVIYEMDDFTTV